MRGRQLLAAGVGYLGVLGLLAVMYVLSRTGGSCASGGPYVIANECPGGEWLLPGLVMGSIFLLIAGGMAFFLVGGDANPALSPWAAVLPGTPLCAVFGVVAGAVSLFGAYGPGAEEGGQFGAWVAAVIWPGMGIGGWLLVRWLRAS